MYKTTRGFTLIEIIITVSILGILAMIGAASYSNIQRDSRDQRRANAITIIGESLESYYDKNGEYLDCDNASDEPLTSLKNSGILNDDSVLIAPKNDTVSLSCSEPSITDDYYQYDGNKYSWKLRYFSEAKGQIIEELTSRRGSIIISNPNLPNLNTMVLTTSDITTSSVRITWNEIVNASKYFIQYSTDDNFPNGDTTKTQFINNPKTTEYELADLDSDTKYYVRARAIGDEVSYNNGDYSDVIDVTTETVPVTEPPATPNVTANTSGDDTTWSWDPVVCPIGWILEYKYRYFTEAYDGGWDENPNNYVVTGTKYNRSLSSGGTNFPGYTFMVEVKAICKKAGKPNLESGVGSAFYKKPPIMTQITNNTVGDRTTWSWNNVFCPINNHVIYHYRFTYTGFNSDWQPDNSQTIVDVYPDNPNGYTIEYESSRQKYSRNTAEVGIDYKLEVQARCIKDDDSEKISDWSNTETSIYKRNWKTPEKPDLSVSLIENNTKAEWRWPHIDQCGLINNINAIPRFRYYIYNSSSGSLDSRTDWLYLASDKRSLQNGALNASIKLQTAWGLLSDNTFIIPVGQTGKIYELEVQVKCTNNNDTMPSEWSESGFASYSLDISSNPAPGAPVITSSFDSSNSRYINFQWTNPCPAGSAVEYDAVYSNNYNTSSPSWVDSENTYRVSLGTDEGRIGTIKVKARCIYNNIFKTLWGPQATNSRKRLITNPTTPVWTNVVRDTNNNHPTLKIEVTSNCGSGSSLYGIADMYAPPPFLNYNNVSETLYSGWYGTGDESTWLFSPYENVGSGIRITTYVFILGSSVPYYVPTGTKLQFKARFYCQSDLTGEKSAVSSVSLSGEKAVP